MYAMPISSGWLLKGELARPWSHHHTSIMNDRAKDSTMTMPKNVRAMVCNEGAVR